jgi:hypothetical protein
VTDPLRHEKHGNDPFILVSFSLLAVSLRQRDPVFLVSAHRIHPKVFRVLICNGEHRCGRVPAAVVTRCSPKREDESHSRRLGSSRQGGFTLDHVPSVPRVGLRGVRARQGT